MKTRKRKVMHPMRSIGLPYRPEQVIDLNKKQADEAIAMGFAIPVDADGNPEDQDDSELQAQLDAANAKSTELEAKLTEAFTALAQEKTKSAELQTQLDAKEAANEVLGKKLEEALKPATPAKAPDAEKATDKGAANAEKR